MNSTANRLRRWSRNVHRELSFFFSGMLLIYAVSGLVMNHRDTINPNYSVEQRRYVGRGAASRTGSADARRRRPSARAAGRGRQLHQTLFSGIGRAQSLPQRRFEPHRTAIGRRGVRQEADAPSRAGGHDAPALQSRAVVDVVLGICSPWDSWRSSQAACCCSKGRRGFGARRRGTGRRYRRSIVVS